MAGFCKTCDNLVYTIHNNMCVHCALALAASEEAKATTTRPVISFKDVKDALVGKHPRMFSSEFETEFRFMVEYHERGGIEAYKAIPAESKLDFVAPGEMMTTFNMEDFVSSILQPWLDAYRHDECYVISLSCGRIFEIDEKTCQSSDLTRKGETTFNYPGPLLDPKIVRAKKRKTFYFTVCADDHWFLICVDVRTGEVRVYDSLAHDRLLEPNYLKILTTLFSQMGVRHPQLHTVDNSALVYAQSPTDKINCGFFVLVHLLHEATGVLPWWKNAADMGSFGRALYTFCLLFNRLPFVVVAP
jgi:hypothetical protein